MKLIHSNYEILEQGKGLDGINEHIELAGRTCYKSEPKYRYWSEDGKRFLNKDTEDFKRFYSEKEYPIQENISAKAFVDRMIKSGHGAMLEHGTVYLICPIEEDASIFNRYYKNKYSICKNYMFNGKGSTFITTNLRVLVDNGWLDDLKYLSEPIPNGHEKRITVKFTCDRGVSHEFVRHRVFSFAQESTRYCNYSKDKFGNQLTFIIPSWLNVENCIREFGSLTELEYHKDIDKFQSSELANESNFLQSIAWSESNYMIMIRNGIKPQQARAVLPNALKTELVMTGFISDWEHFFQLRCDKTAHPDAQALAKPLHEEFIKKGYIDGNLD